ncbi:hypothetical protein C0992_001096 [Termitomyces sp. T32_za158]|nr:hypothetical protein C0992_001096 [Termitomyces sp. T32_za158]
MGAFQDRIKSKIDNLIALFFSATATPIPGPTTGCSDVHVITARASGEAPGEGIIGAVVTAIVDGSSQTVSREAVVYPATLTNYLVSESEGVTAMRAQLAAQVSACPSTKIVLMGYSQGAQVTGDVLALRATGTDQGRERTAVFIRTYVDSCLQWRQRS